MGGEMAMQKPWARPLRTVLVGETITDIVDADGNTVIWSANPTVARRIVLAVNSFEAMREALTKIAEWRASDTVYDSAGEVLDFAEKTARAALALADKEMP